MSLLDTSNELSTAYLNSPMSAISHSCPCTTVATYSQSSVCHTSSRTRSGKAFYPVSPISDNVSFVDASIGYSVPAVASCAVVDYHVPSPSFAISSYTHTQSHSYGATPGWRERRIRRWKRARCDVCHVYNCSSDVPLYDACGITIVSTYYEPLFFARGCPVVHQLPAPVMFQPVHPADVHLLDGNMAEPAMCLTPP